MRIKRRTEERIEISQAKANYWKWYREGGKDKRTGEKSDRREEERRKVWIRLNEEIISLEEDGEWILEEDEER